MDRSSTPSYDDQDLDSMGDQLASEDKKAASKPRERECDCQMRSANKLLNTEKGESERYSSKVDESQEDGGKESLKKVRLFILLCTRRLIPSN